MARSGPWRAKRSAINAMASAAAAKVAALAMAAAAAPASSSSRIGIGLDMRTIVLVCMQGTSFVTWRALTNSAPLWQHSCGSSGSTHKGSGSGTGSSSSSVGISSSSNGDVGLNVAVNDHVALPAEVAKPVSVLQRSCSENSRAFNSTRPHLWLYVQSKKKQKHYCIKKKTNSRPAYISKPRDSVRRSRDDKVALSSFVAALIF